MSDCHTKHTTIEYDTWWHVSICVFGFILTNPQLYPNEDYKNCQNIDTNGLKIVST